MVDLEPSDLCLILGLSENCSIDDIEKLRESFIEKADVSLGNSLFTTAKGYRRQAKLCDDLIKFKSGEQLLQDETLQKSNQDFQSEFLSNEFIPNDASLCYKILAISENSSVQEIELACQQLIEKINFPCGKNTVAINKCQKVREIGKYLLEQKIQDLDVEMYSEDDGSISPSETSMEIGSSNEVESQFNDTMNSHDDKIIESFEFISLENSDGNKIEQEEDKVIDQSSNYNHENLKVSKDSINQNDKEQYRNVSNYDKASHKNFVKKDLFLSFEEIFRGESKRITLRVMDGDTKFKEEKIRIKIKHGILPGTEIPFPVETDSANVQPKLIFVVRDIPDQKYTRRNCSDIEYTVNITEKQSKNGCEVFIPTLENDPITMTVEDEITEDVVEIFDDRGLPHLDNKRMRGKLLVKFKISKEQNSPTNYDNSNFNVVVIQKHDYEQENEEFEFDQKLIDLNDKETNELKITANKNTSNLDKQNDKTVNMKSKVLPTEKVENQNRNQIQNKSDDFKCGKSKPKIPNVKEMPQNKKLSPIKCNLNLTLEEIFRGCVKYSKINAKFADKDGIEHQKEKVVKVIVNPGSIDGTEIIYQNEDDLIDEQIMADIIFTVREETNSIFTRIGYDIQYLAKITPREAIMGGELFIPTFENNDPYQLSFSGGISINTIERIPNLGLPIQNNKGKTRGDLLVKFDVMFDQEQQQDPPFEQDISITLEQILYGCNKRVQIRRIVINPDGSEREEPKILTMDIKPGTKTGTKFVFPREGDQYAGSIPADIVLIVRDKPHEIFTRKGVDIEQIVEITKSQLSNGAILMIPTLGDGGSKKLSLNDIVNIKSVRRMPNLGLPHPDKPDKRGDLIVRFNIVEDPQDDQVKRDLEISLEQVLSGCIKKLNITRNIFDYSGKKVNTENKVIEIPIIAGTLEGEKYLYEKLGDKNSGRTPADIVFVLRYKEHPHFKRNGFDLIYTAPITKSEAQDGVELEISTLDDLLTFTTKKGVKENGTKEFKNYGLPFPGDPQKRGRLIVTYKIVDDNMKDQQIEEDLQLTLEQIYSGCEKRRKINRLLQDYDGNKTTEEKTLTIKVPSGTKAGEKFVFSRLGDKKLNRIPADIVFVAQEKLHNLYVRKGNNLEYTATLTESKAKPGFEVKVPTIDNDIKKFCLPKKFKKHEPKKLEGLGLPIPNRPNKYGDIIVKFNVIKDVEKSKQTKKSDDLKNKNKTQTIDNSRKNEDSTNKKDKQIENEAKGEPVECYLPVSLQNILRGCTKRMRIKRLVQEEGKEEYEENEIVEIEIKPGSETGTRHTFPNAGDKLLNSIPPDIVFIIIIDEKQDKFTRIGADLQYVAKLTEDQFIKGCELQIETIDGEKIPLVFDEKIVDIDQVKRIPGYGLPYLNNPEARGDLIVKFDIIFNQNENPIQESETSFKNQELCEIPSMPQDPAIYINLPLRLENILHGCQDTMQIDRKVYFLDGNYYPERVNLPINVKPGTLYGTHFVFKQEGDRRPGMLPADIIFVAIEIKHMYFDRFGVDIEIRAQISMNKAINGGELDIPTLDGHFVPIGWKTVKPNSVQKIPGFGLPYLDDSKRRGNLLVRFKIIDDDILTKITNFFIR